MAKTVTIRTNGNAMKALNALADKIGDGRTLSVGFFKTERYTTVHPIRGTKRKPLPVAQVAFWNEYGTENSPPRPFFRGMITDQMRTWSDKLKHGFRFTHNDGHKTLELLGVDMKDHLQQSIVQFSDPANAPRTIRIKGFDDPLIDDGTMQRAVGYEVKDAP